MEAEGSLFVYDSETRRSAFVFGTGSEEPKGYVVFIGGLTDGFLCVPYLNKLHEAVSAKGWALVQPLLRSSYDSFGFRSLHTDVQDLYQFVVKLYERHEQKYSSTTPLKLILCGHSTGCQDIVKFVSKYSSTITTSNQLDEYATVCGACLQGPVSDRECLATLMGDEELKNALQMAHVSVQHGRGNEILEVDLGLGDAPISAERMISLGSRLGEDDMFSADLTAEELKKIFKRMTVSTVLVESMSDEYVPEGINRMDVLERISEAIPGKTRLLFLEGANHSLGSSEAAQRGLIAEVVEFISQS